MAYTLIVAASSKSGGIGSKGTLPWRLKEDMAYFKDVTLSTPSGENKQNVCIMGRKTWESIPVKFRPLNGRINVVLSRSSSPPADYPEGVIQASSLVDAKVKLASLSTPSSPSSVGTVFVIGGSQIYDLAMASGDVDTVLLTEIDVKADEEKCAFDAFFPKLDSNEWSVSDVGNGEKTDDKTGYSYKFLKYLNKKHIPSPSLTAAKPAGIEEGPLVNPEEMQYLDLCRDVIENGVRRMDRTGTGTLSKFGVQMRFSLRDDAMPMLTTKRVFWRGVAEELLWFVKGTTNANELAEKDVHIWDGNGSREFLDSRGLHDREVGDLGPVYGFQWRHFGAKYTDMHADYKGQGVDQLADCINKIKTNPTDRRIIMSAWNPSDLDIMALPPCHMFCQFFVDTEKGELSCQMYQRSADLGLGVPFNIASYALLTHMVAKVCGLKAGDFVHVMGDAHVYLNHVDAIQEQLLRGPRAFPKIRINPGVNDIDGFDMKDFTVEGYTPHKAIKMQMAV